MKIIRAAKVYRLDLPPAAVLSDHLAELPHREISETEFSTRGFTPPLGQGELVLPIEGGYAFSVRYDEKIVPAAVTAAEAKKRIAEYETKYETRLNNVDRQRIREEVFSDFCRKALVRPTTVTCFYRTADRLLIVPTSSRKLADVVTGSLVQVVGSIKAQTIYVSDAKHGLTTRLRAYLEGDECAFDGFSVGGSCKLKLPESRTVVVKMGDLTEASVGLLEALAHSAVVEEISLTTASVGFRLASDFVIKGIEFNDEVEPDGARSALEDWIQEAGVRALQFADVVNRLCDLLGYKEPEDGATADDLV